MDSPTPTPPYAHTPILPYGRQSIDEADIAAVVETLHSNWLTTGPKVEEFERLFAEFVGARHAVAISNGTAALHASMVAAGIGAGDEVIVPPMTFAASANCIVYCGGTPVFADVEAETLLIDAAQVEAKITPRTKAIIAVDYAGHPCNYDALRRIANRHGLLLVDDACHAVGGQYRSRNVGTLADLNTFSFHPVKSMTTGEGGMVTTDNADFAQRMRVFRNHGITTEHRQREQQGTWFYEMVDLGFNYRISDFQCALGISQLRKLPGWVLRRQEIARRYNEAFAGRPAISPLAVRDDVSHGYHLYVIRVDFERHGMTRVRAMADLRSCGIGTQVHYIPVHLHPYYRQRFGTGPGLCPVAEAAYERILSLPIFPGMTDSDVDRVIATVLEISSR
jgi:perosamine synthetase